MLKRFCLISALLLAPFFGSLLDGKGGLQADPSDDFSFSLKHGPEEKAYRLLNAKQVETIFRDRLDLFPVSQLPTVSRHFLRLCEEHRFDPAFVLSLIEVESSFRIKVISEMGAVGLMQVLPSTARIVTRDWGLNIKSYRSALQDPYFNLSVGIAYLATLRNRYRGMSPYYLVAAYNAGPGKIDELIERKSWEPRQTKRYYNEIRKQLQGMRFYQRADRV